MVRLQTVCTSSRVVLSSGFDVRSTMMVISGRECWRPTGTDGKAMVVTEERLFQWRKVCAGPSKCGHGGMGDGLTGAYFGDAKVD